MVFNKLFPGETPSCGITLGRERAQVGVWAIWSPKKENAFLRVHIEFSGSGTSHDGLKASYAFLPLTTSPRWHALEFSPEMRGCLVGPNPAKSGQFQFTFEFLDRSSQKLIKSLEDIRAYYRLLGPKQPSRPDASEKEWLADSPEVAALDHDGLLARSEKLVHEQREREEQARKEAEEAKQKLLEAQRAAQRGKAPAQAAAGAAAPAKTDDVPKAKIGLVYGSSTGNTADISDQIKAAFGGSEFVVRNVTEISRSVFEKFDNIILGVPTWHIGEMQDDWAAFLPDLDAGKLKLNGKKLAIFGLGDGKGYPDTYVDAMIELWEKFEPSGIELVGLWPTDGYEYEKSKAIIKGKFVGLVIDIENQNDLTEERVKGWVDQLKGELNL